MFLFGNPHAKGPRHAAPGCQGKVFINSHGSSGTHHRVLEHAADVFGTLVLRKACHIFSVNDDFAHIDRPYARHRIQHGGTLDRVFANHRHKISVFQFEIQAIQGTFSFTVPALKVL